MISGKRFVGGWPILQLQISGPPIWNWAISMRLVFLPAFVALAVCGCSAAKIVGAGVFNGTDAYLSATSSVIGSTPSYPVAMACWFKPDSLDNNQVMMSICDDGTGGNDRINIKKNGLNDVLGMGIQHSGNTTAFRQTSNNISLNWHLAILLAVASDDWRIILDGDTANQGQNTNDRPVSGLASFAIGAQYLNTPSQFFPGKIAEVAVWTSVDETSFVNSTIPELLAGVRPPNAANSGSLVLYQPLRDGANEFDTEGPTLTVDGASFDQNEHPPVFYPQVRRHFERRRR